MNANLKKTSFAIVFLVLLFTNSYADNEVTEGYDENTEITIRGKLKEAGREMRGPVIVLLQSGSRDYRVVTAPPWYLAQEGIELKTGTSYEVTGSKIFARDGNIYIVASRIKDFSTGKIIQLRDSSCKPLWRGRGTRKGMN
jgi:hypothetical protein